MISIGAATDYLYTLAQTAVAGMTVAGQPVTTHDGEPDEVTLAMLVVGLSDPPPDFSGDTNGTRSWDGLGGLRLTEDYTIPCYIDVRLPGIVQKTARDDAEAIFNAYWALIVADLTLGGALKGGRFAEIDSLTSTPSNVGTVAEPGRRQFISFGVHCRSVTT